VYGLHALVIIIKKTTSGTSMTGFQTNVL